MQPNMNIRASPEQCRLVVTNLSPNVSEAELRTLFQDYGNCRVSIRMYAPILSFLLERN